MAAKKKSGKIFFWRERNFRKFFLRENPFTHSPTKQNYLQLPKNPTTQKPKKNHPYPQFSDVIARMGNSGHPAVFFSLFDVNSMPKKSARKSPLNCRVKSRLKSLFSKNNRFKRYFLSAWTPLPLEPENWVHKKAIGAQIEPGIPHVPETHDLPAKHPYSPT